jgi:large subunit ribosomal protein L31e
MEERIITINLRRNSLKVSRNQKAKRAINTVRKSLKRHMKSDDIEIGSSINEIIWKGGSQKIPPKIKLKVVKKDDGKVIAELWGEIKEEVEPEVTEKPEEKESKEEKTEEKKPEKTKKKSKSTKSSDK